MLLGTHPDALKSERTQQIYYPCVPGTHALFPCKTIHCEQQLVLKITVTSTRNPAVRRPGKCCFKPPAHLLNTHDILCAQSRNMLL